VNSLQQVEQSACGAVLSYVIETQQGKFPHLQNPKNFEASTALSIDPATRNSLELVKTLSGDKKGSVLWVMDRTVTGPGARMLASRLRNITFVNILTRVEAPLTNVQEIEARLDCVEFFKKNAAFIEDVCIELIHFNL
jgi:DNA mismatch repair protein MutS